MTVPKLDSNIFYRITNAVLGDSLSLDVVNSKEGAALGEVDIAPSGPFNGQLWQFLKTNTTGKGTYYVSNLLRGAGKKLDISVGKNAVYSPVLRNFTTEYDQTWIVSRYHNSTKNNATYTIRPSFLRGTVGMTIDNQTEAPLLKSMGGVYQQWVVTAVMEINNDSFSATALLATTTAASTVPSTSPTTCSQQQETSTPACFISHDSKPHLPMSYATAAAIIVASVTLFIAVIILVILLVNWRRRAARLKRGEPSIPNFQDTNSVAREERETTEPWSTIPPSIPSSSSSESRLSLALPGFNPLVPRPMSTARRPHDRSPSNDSSKVDSLAEQSPPVSPLDPVEIRVHRASRQTPSPSDYAASPISTTYSMFEGEGAQDTDTHLTVPRSLRRPRPRSLISRWRL